MKKALLDSSFIITCVKNKIDFFNYLEEEGYKILIPKKVIEEIKHVAESKKKLKDKDIATLSLKILMMKDFKAIETKGKTTDNSIINYGKENPETIIATLDKEIKFKIKNKRLIIRNKKKLELR